MRPLSHVDRLFATDGPTEGSLDKIARTGGTKVLEHLGSARTGTELAALLETARGRIYPGQEQLDLSAGSVPGGPGGDHGRSGALLWDVLSAAYARLWFDVLGDEAFTWSIHRGARQLAGCGPLRSLASGCHGRE